MIRDLGVIKPGTTIYLPFHTFDSNDPSASVTLTGLATTDIEIYKDGGTTQRASDAGYSLLDTDGIDFDGITGIHGLSIDLADNTTAGFYAAGSQYWIVVSSVTVDGATINFVLATFRIGTPGAFLDTTIATLSSQTSFTLTKGPAEASALLGCICYIHDVASEVQGGFGVVSAYDVTTKTVTLTAGVSFTAAATDNISFFPPANVQYMAGIAPTAASVTNRNTVYDTDFASNYDTTLKAWHADVISIKDSSTAANNLKNSLLAMASGTVAADGSNSATSFKIDSTLGAKTTDYFGSANGGLVLVFIAGTTNEFQSRRVTGFNGTTDFITVEEAFSATPTTSDTFILIGRIEV